MSCYTLRVVINRREFAVGLSALTLGAAEKPESQYLELRWFQLRNNHANQFQRTSDYIQALGPVLKREGATSVGSFSSVIGPETPFIITLTAYPNLAAVEAVSQRLPTDKTVDAALRSLHNGEGAPFERSETWLLRAFAGFPAVRPAAEPKPGRIFELRQYESQDYVTLARKIDMFNAGEIGVFERLGMGPVFFGQMLYGPRMPNLVYMLSFDDIAARDRLWHAFGTDPEWKKMSARPDLQDTEIVSNISNWILRPLTFSDIR